MTHNKSANFHCVLSATFGFWVAHTPSNFHNRVHTTHFPMETVVSFLDTAK